MSQTIIALSTTEQLAAAIPEKEQNALDLLRKYSSHRINQSCNQIYP